MKEKMEKIMEYTGASTEKVLALDAYQFDAAYTCVLNIEENLKALKRFGLELEEEDCGCGGCEANINEAILETLDLDTLVTAFDDLAGDETALVALIAHIVESVNDYEVQ